MKPTISAHRDKKENEASVSSGEIKLVFQYLEDFQQFCVAVFNDGEYICEDCDSDLLVATSNATREAFGILKGANHG